MQRSNSALLHTKLVVGQYYSNLYAEKQIVKCTLSNLSYAYHFHSIRNKTNQRKRGAANRQEMANGKNAGIS